MTNERLEEIRGQFFATGHTPRPAGTDSLHQSWLDGQELLAEIVRLRAEVAKLHGITEVQGCEEEELVMENEALRQALKGGPDVQDGPEGVGILAPNLELAAIRLSRLADLDALRLSGILDAQARQIRVALQPKESP